MSVCGIYTNLTPDICLGLAKPGDSGHFLHFWLFVRRPVRRPVQQPAN